MEHVNRFRPRQAATLVQFLALAATAWLLALAPAHAARPIILPPLTLTNGVEDTAFTISYNTLTNAAFASDPDGDAVSLRVESLISGTLTESGTNVVAGSTLLSSGESWVWTPALNANGVAVAAFTIKAVAGGEDSTGQAVTVTVQVAPVNDAPTLGDISTLSSAVEDTNFTITYTTLFNESDAKDVDGDTLSFRVISVSTGTLTQGGTNAVDTTLSSGGSLVWLPATNQTGTLNAFAVVVNDGTVDSTNSVQVSVSVSNVNDPPTITGTLAGGVSVPIPDNQPTNLFAGLTVGDIDSSSVTITVSLTGGEDQGGTFLGTSDPNEIVLTGSPSAVTTALRTNVFSPTPNIIDPGQSKSFTLSIDLEDAENDSSTSALQGSNMVYVQGVNDPPTISVTINPSTITDGQDVSPFSVNINDPDNDPAETYSLTVSIVNISPVSSSSVVFGSLSPTGPYTGTETTVEATVGTLQFRPVRDSVDGSQIVEFRFTITDQGGAGGSGTASVQLTITGENDPPDILGVSTTLLRITDDVTDFRPFRNVRVEDIDGAGAQIMRSTTISVSDPSKGTFSPPGPFTNMTPAQVTERLRSVIFLPDGSRIPEGQTETVSMTIRVEDIQGAVRSDNRTTVAITSVNGAPKINNVPPLANQPLLIPPLLVANPFTGIVIEDDNTNLTVTVSIDDPDKGELIGNNGFTETGPDTGVYVVQGTPASVTTALANLGFQVNPTFLFPPNEPGGTTFTITAADNALNSTTKTLSILLQNEPRNLLVLSDEDTLEEGSLRYAVANAGNNDFITFALPSYPAVIRLDAALGPVVLSRNVLLAGPGAHLLTISGDSDGNLIPDTRLFEVDAAVTMQGMTLTRGLGQETPEGPVTGGAIYVGPRGRLIMNACVVSDSEAAQWGGAIDVNQGSLLMKNCLLRNNRTDDAIGMGGGAVSLYTDLPCAFINTTFSGNEQRAATGLGGGALYVENFEPGTELLVEVSQSTFAGNSDAADLGSSIAANVFGTTVTARNSIFADGLARNLEVQGAGRIVSKGGNVSDDSTSTILTQGGQPRAVILLDQSTDQTKVDAHLGGFDPQILPVPGHPLLTNSPAIGLAVAGYEAVDQVGRIRDGDPDSGALERQAMQRLVLNEIQFNPAPGSPDFLEFYVLRDSLAVNLSNYDVWVDGTNKHQFAAGTVVQPGRGLILADGTVTIEAPTNAPVTPVLQATNAPLNLSERGLVELRHRTTGSNILAAVYNGVIVDLGNVTMNESYTTNSLTLAPEFTGFAYLPHEIVLKGPLGGANLDLGGDPNSPGGSTTAPFGVANDFPIANDDAFLVHEDTPLVAQVLANDLDADGLDELVVINLGLTNTFASTTATLTSPLGAVVTIDDTTTPLPGGAIVYDPRPGTEFLQSMPEGTRRTESFYYEVIDYGTGPILDFEGMAGDTNVVVVSPGHRLATNETVIISGSSLPAYNREFAVLPVAGDEDRFIIDVDYDGIPATKGSWRTRDPRTPTDSAIARVSMTILGANDPPMPAMDGIASDEETILRIMADDTLIGSGTSFSTDALFMVPPVVAPLSLLANDEDPDTDDNEATLRVVGVISSVHSIDRYTGTSGLGPVTVESPAHGLESDTEILISGYGGHPSYNGFHVVEVIDEDTFAIPAFYVDDAEDKGVWVILNDDNRASALSEFGAEVALELRANRAETSVTYNPRTSTYLNGISSGTNGFDSFYYAVEDRHGAVSIAPVLLQIDGVNDDPVLAPDPDTLAQLNGLVGEGETLGDVIERLQIHYYLPSIPAQPSRLNAQVEFDDNGSVSGYLLEDLQFTYEDTPVSLLTSVLLANDSDEDTNDVLNVSSVAAFSREGAAVTLNGLAVTYDPRTSESLNSLAREEPMIDTFEITVTDAHGGFVTSTVAVLVLGRNDTPVARDDNVTAVEDTVLVFDPLLHPSSNSSLWDEDADINGSVPDNELAVLDAPRQETTVPGAFFSISNNLVQYDPTGSEEFNVLGQGEIYPVPDHFTYTIRDYSLLFANDDRFKVTADGEGYELNVLANDRNFNTPDGLMEVVSLGVPDQLGEVVLAENGIIVYTPEINFVGNEVFTYTLSDGLGHVDQGLVNVQVTVNQLNGNLQANADRFSVARGESPLLDVLANDNILPAGSAGLTITRIVSEPDQDGLAVLEDGAIRFTPDLSYAGTYPYTDSFSYEISGGLTARAIAEVHVLVINREGTLTIGNDSFSVLPDSSDNALDVLANDNILPGGPDNLVIVDFNQPAHGTVSTNTSSDRLIYQPDPGFVGTDAFSYVASDGLGGTGTGQVTVSVGRITVSDDFFAVPINQTNVLDVLANDAVRQGSLGFVTITQVSPTNTAIGVFSRGTGMTNLVLISTNTAGLQATVTYTVSDGTGGMATGNVTVVLDDEGVNANPDFFSALTDSAANELDVLRNDAAIPDAGRMLTLVSIGTGLDAPNRGGSVTVDATNTKLIYTPAPGFAGEESFTYTMTDSRGTDSAKVVVTVTDGDLLANDDTYTVFYEVPMSPAVTLASEDILDLPGWVTALNNSNDPVSSYLLSRFSPETLALLAQGPSAAQDPELAMALVDDIDAVIGGPSIYESGAFSNVVLSVVTQSLLAQEQKTLFVRRLNYMLILDAYPAVLARPEPMPFTLSVLDNDAVLPDFGQLLLITGVGIDSSTSSNSPDRLGTVEVNEEGLALIYTPRDEFGEFPYDETFTYEISDGSERRAEGTVTVRVLQRANARDLDTNDDEFSVEGDSQNNVLNVLANDNIKPAGGGGWTLTSVSEPFHEKVNEVDLTGVAIISGPFIQYTPPPGFIGTETFIYTVSDGLGGTGLGSVKVKVGDLPLCPDGFTAMSGSTDNLLDVLNNDGVFPRVAEEFVLLAASPGSHHGTITVTNGMIHYTPDADYAGPFPYTETFAYQVRDDSLMTVTGIASVQVHETGSDRATAEVNVTVVGVNDAPFISGTVAGQTVYEHSSLRPFASVKITEIDRGGVEPVWLRVRLDDPTHGYLVALGAFQDVGGGQYELGSAGQGVTAAEATAALRELTFVPTTLDRVTPGNPETTRFTIEVEDGLAATVTDDSTTVLAVDAYVDKLLANNGNTGEEFGFAVASTRDWIAVGVPFHGTGEGLQAGSVFIFARRQDGSDRWDAVQTLLPADLQEGDQFGWAVAMTPDTLAVGSKFGGANGRESGTVHVFTRTPNDPLPWTFQQKIFPSDGAGDDQFGFAVDVSDDLIVVGANRDDDMGNASGAAYVFRHVAVSNAWFEVDKLLASDGDQEDRFGNGVGIDGAEIIVGAPMANPDGFPEIGEAYLFRMNPFNSNEWNEVRALVAEDGASGDLFGQVVDISEGWVAIGASRHMDTTRSGAVYVHARDAGGNEQWGLDKKILPADGADNDEFGFSVALDGAVVLIGSSQDDDNGTRSGSSYVYARQSDDWRLVEKLTPPDGDAYDEFGFAVALREDTAVVGARRDEQNGDRFGSAYVFRLKFNNPPGASMPLPEIVAGVEENLMLTLPAELFADPDLLLGLALLGGATDNIILQATLEDGSNLPDWLTFDPATATFTGFPVEPFDDIIRVTATDEEGASISSSFALSVRDLSGSETNGIGTPDIVLEITHDPVQAELSLTYLRPLGAIDSSYTLESTSMFSSWGSAESAIVAKAIIPSADEMERVVLRIRLIDFAENYQFFRIKHTP